MKDGKEEEEAVVFRDEAVFRQTGQPPPAAVEEVGPVADGEMALHSANKYELSELDVIFRAGTNSQRRRPRRSSKRQTYCKSEKFPKLQQCSESLNLHS